MTEPSPSPTESKRLFYTSVSLLLSRTQGYRYHLSKFHIYAFVYCIGLTQIEPGSPVLQADSLLSEPPGKPWLQSFRRANELVFSMEEEISLLL